MRPMCLLSAIFSLICSAFCSAQPAHNGGAEEQRCVNASSEIQVIVQREQAAKGFSLQTSSVPSLAEALISLQVDASSGPTPALRQMQFCEITPSMFHIRDGRVIETTIAVDRDFPTWLVGLAPSGETFLLSGFSDPLNGFNDLIKAIGLQVSADLVAGVFDFYLRLTGGESLRKSITVDEMQLQSEGLEDFRFRYSLPKAHSTYVKWWNGITPAIKKQLHRPEVTAGKDGFKVNYFRYSQGQLLQEFVIISKRGAVTVGPTKVLYAFNSQ